jgi:dihydropteroate synthase
MVKKQTLTKPEEMKRVIPLAGGRQLPLSRPLVMGILNVTPDSFSDGGQFGTPQAALQRAMVMAQEGADIIDVGGESTRPGAKPVSAEEELHRVIPAIDLITRNCNVCVSVDTYRAATAAAAIDVGAQMVNDISALRFDDWMAEIIADRKVPVILMHMQGKPGDMQEAPFYHDCVTEVREFFEERIDYCISRSILKTKLILDPGIGFGKRLNDNLEILARLDHFKKLGLPLLIGASRKSFIQMLSQSDSQADQRFGGSIAAAVASVINGANIVRVHDVAPTVEALKVIQGISASRVSDD